jgi:hypothetical protein
MSWKLFFANNSAVALPIPEVAPVISTVFVMDPYFKVKDSLFVR